VNKSNRAGTLNFRPEFKDAAERAFYSTQRESVMDLLVAKGMPFRAATLEAERQAWKAVTDRRKRDGK
jgi:hypothetical protein